MIIGFVKGQQFSKKQPLIVSNSINYLEAKFVFQTSDWSELVKFAHFKSGDSVYDFLLDGDTIPKEAQLNLYAGNWEVYIHGDRYVVDDDGNEKIVERITTNTQTVQVVKYEQSGSVLPEVGTSVAEQIAAVADNAKKIATSVRNEADAGAFDGKDGVSVTHEWEGTVLKVTSASGTTSADLIGPGAEQPDWNANEGEAGHILNRTHYKKLVDLFPEKTITFEYGSYAEEWPKDPFKVDETYIVTWGDEKYECKGLLFEDVVNVDGNDVFVSVAFIGNTILFGSEDSGEPFGAVWQDGQLVIVPADNSTSKRVRIQKYVYKPLERGFMPCHIVTLPAMDDRPAMHEDATVSITDESGEIIQALMNNYPVYLDLKLVREGPVARSLVIGFSTAWSENRIRKAISAGEASTIPFYMEAREAFNDSTWTIYVNVTD